MNIPQVKSTLASFIIIIIVVPIVQLGYMEVKGDITTWSELFGPKGFVWANESFYHSFLLAAGWIFLRSPYARRITELIGSKDSTLADGTQVKSESKITISQPPLEASPDPAPPPKG